MSGGYVLYQPLVYLRVSVRYAGEYIYISAWASALSVLTGLGNAKAFVERDGHGSARSAPCRYRCSFPTLTRSPESSASDKCGMRW